MLRAFLFFLILTLPSVSFAFHQINLESVTDLGSPLFIALDDEGRIYSTQKDGTVLVKTAEGEVVMTLGGKDSQGEWILKSPSGIFFSGGKIYVADEALGQVVVFSRDGDLQYRFGKKGGAAKEFDSPQGIYVSAGVIYVADEDNDRVQAIGPNGVYMGSFGTEGEGSTLLDNPSDVAVDYWGNVYAVDTGNRLLKVYSSSGEYLGKSPQMEAPYSIDIDSEGVLVSDSKKYNISKYDFKWKNLFSFGAKGSEKGQFLSMGGISLDKAGKIYIADTQKGEVQVFSPEVVPYHDNFLPPTAVRWVNNADFKVSKIISDGSRFYAVSGSHKAIWVIKDGALEKTINVPDCSPVSVALDSEGELWVLDGKGPRVLKLNQQGQIVLSFGSSGSRPGYFSRPSDIKVSRKGIVFVADRGNERVQVFNSNGTFLNVVGAKGTDNLIQGPLALAVDAEENLYVLDDERKKVLVFSPEGLPIREIGGAGEGRKKFDKPVDIAVNDNEIFVLDAGQRCVKVFNKDGGFGRLFGSTGNGHGEFLKPVALTLKSDIELVVADENREDIQMFQFIYTPQAPQNLKAVEGMRTVGLSWEKNPETFVDQYKIYRSEEGKNIFSEIAIADSNVFQDCDVLPGHRYEYRVSALARQGNESALCQPSSAVPVKTLPESPVGLGANAQEWSVELIWESNKEDFVDHYVICRLEDGVSYEAGRVKTPYFFEESLEPDTPYTYLVSAVSIDNLESEKISIKTKTLPATKPPLEIKVLEMHDVFSNTYKIYENEGIGRISVVNNTIAPILNLKVSFTIKEFMDFPSEAEIEILQPGESREFPIKAVFNNSILNVTEDTPVQAEIKASYYENQEPKSCTKNQTLNLYEKHRMMWDVKERFASFVTSKDSVVLEFTRLMVTQYPELNDPFLFAGVMFDALGFLGFTYMQDPSNPYQITSEKTDFVDYIQYPRETLKRKSGDCDDLVGLYSSILESLGIQTMVLEIPGHMFMMFSSGIESEKDEMDGMFLAHEGVLWVPVEVTLVGGSFMKAWEAGSKTYHGWRGRGLELMDIRSAWEKFKPASLPMSDWRPQHVEKAELEKMFFNEVQTLRKISVRNKGRKYLDRLDADPDDARALLQLGIVYAKAGEVEDGVNIFKKALELDPGNAAIENNLGNAYFIQGNFEAAQEAYENASILAPDDPELWVNLVRCRLRLGNKEGAIEAFKNATELDPDIKTKYRAISLKVSSVF